MKKEHSLTCRECYIPLSVLTSLDYQGYCSSCAKKQGNVILLPKQEMDKRNPPC